MQVAARHGPGAARGSGPPFVPSVPLDLVLVPVTEEHGVDVIDEVGHCKLRVGRGKPVSVGRRERGAGIREERRWLEQRPGARVSAGWATGSQIASDIHSNPEMAGLSSSVMEPKGREQETGPRSDGHNADR